MPLTAEEILSRFQAVQKNGPEDWTCLCPAHQDKNRSLHVTQAQNGKLLFKCFAGCSAEAVLHAVGLSWSDLPGGETNIQPFRRYGLTVQQYADAKKIPAQVLRAQFRIEDGQHICKNGRSYPGVKIPYLRADGSLARYRWRMCLKQGDAPTAPSKFLWDAAGGGNMLLYGLWRQPKDRSRVILVEGESDCHTLWNAGFPALGMPGVSNYKPERDDEILRQYGSPERPAIFVHIEPDEGGFNLFRRLTGLDGRRASGVLDRLLFFSLPGYKDPSDAWCALAGQPAQFSALVSNALAGAKPWQDFARPTAWTTYEKRAEERAAAQVQPSNSNAASGGADTDGKRRGGARDGAGRKATDFPAIAAAFLRKKWTVKKETALRFWRAAWYAYDGRCYVQIPDSDLEGELMTFLQDKEALKEYGHQTTRNTVQNTLLNLRSTALCGLPQSLRCPSWIHDRTPATDWLPMQNCAVDLAIAPSALLDAEKGGGSQTAEAIAAYTRPLTPDLLATYAMPYPFDPSATCPRFSAWLESTQPSPEMRLAIQHLMGLCLVPDTSYNVCFFLAGEGGTGKTTFLRILERFIGEANTCHVPLLKFAERFQTWPLAENLVNIVGEMPSDDPQGRLRYIEGDFKDSISGENIDCERKGRDTCKARCIARHVFATNTLPKFFDKTEGIWDRLRILPFNVRFRGTDTQVQNIENTFLPDELPGIFNFALRGLADLRRHTTFPECEEMLSAKEQHRNACDPDAEYLKANYAPSEFDEVSLSTAYQHYKDYLEQNGMMRRSSGSFVQAVKRIFGIALMKRRPSFTRVFPGLRALYSTSRYPGQDGDDDAPPPPF